MGPAENIYLRHMTQFAALLRQEGLTVGAGETADACQLLAELDPVSYTHLTLPTN